MGFNQLEHVHKARAEELRAALDAQSVNIRHGHALEGIGATHGHTWAALAKHPDLPVLDASSARTRLVARLRALGTAVAPGQVPDHVLIPYIAPHVALRLLLPPAWARYVGPSVKRAEFDIGRPMVLSLVNGDGVTTGEGARRVTEQDVRHLLDRVGRQREGRAGFTCSSLVVRGVFDPQEGEAGRNFTITTNRDHPGIAAALGQALDGNVLITGPSYDYLGPRLRDIARHLLQRPRTQVHTLEWSGSLTGAGEAPPHDLRGLRRTVADDGLDDLTTIRPEPGQRTVAVIEFPLALPEVPGTRYAEAIQELIARGVQVIVGAYAHRPADLPHLDGGRILSNRMLFPTQLATNELPGTVSGTLPPGRP